MTTFAHHLLSAPSSASDTGPSRNKKFKELGLNCRPVCIRRAGEEHDIFRISFDPNASLIRAYASGCWSIDETQRYITALTAFVSQSRTVFGTARVLLDRREIVTQTNAVADLLAKANGGIFGTDDRIALVVDSSMAKLSLRMRMPHPGTKAFLSIDAAETWLQAFEIRNW